MNLLDSRSPTPSSVQNGRFVAKKKFVCAKSSASFYSNQEEKSYCQNEKHTYKHTQIHSTLTKKKKIKHFLDSKNKKIEEKTNKEKQLEQKMVKK